MPDTSELCEAVEQVLRRREETVRVCDIEVISSAERRNLLARCILDGSSALPVSVIVKQARGDYDVSKVESRDTQRLFRDWLGAEFLAHACTGEHGARFLGGDLGAGLIIVEDLGAATTSMVEPLLGTDPVIGEWALVQYVTRLGRMHADCAGQMPVYEAFARALHPSLPGAFPMPLPPTRRGPDLGVRLGALIETPVEVTDAFVACLEDTGASPFHTFIHGDGCPDNVLRVGGELKLIDFEFARPGAALLDGTYLRVGFPTCWCAGRIPEPVLSRLEARYRTELSRGFPAARDDGVFGRAFASACGHWLVGGLEWLLEGVTSADRDWGITTNRARILTRVEVVASSPECMAHHPALANYCQRLLEVLRAKWPAAMTMPLYPCFG